MTDRGKSAGQGYKYKNGRTLANSYTRVCIRNRNGLQQAQSNSMKIQTWWHLKMKDQRAGTVFPHSPHEHVQVLLLSTAVPYIHTVSRVILRERNTVPRSLSIINSGLMAQLKAVECRDYFLSHCLCVPRLMCIFVLHIYMWRMNLIVQLNGNQIHNVVIFPGRGTIQALLRIIKF